jgi:hypothetical protein
MKEIALIIHEDVTLSTVTGAMYMLIHTNSLFQQLHKQQPFKIVLAGEKSDNNLLQMPSPFISYSSLEEIPNPDVIIVPAFYGDRDEMLKKHHLVISWIKNHASKRGRSSQFMLGYLFPCRGRAVTRKIVHCALEQYGRYCPQIP